MRNIEAELTGTVRADEILVLGAHYDSVEGCPGANDNGSGVAALLEVARALKASRQQRTIRFVAFVNEEPPFFQGPQMGSVVSARRSRVRGERIVGMLSLETIGYYTDAANTQEYPAPLNLLYPSTGNFIGMVSNVRSRQLLTRVATAFRAATRFPIQSAVAPASLPGVGWSDHWAYWQEGYPAVMLTDTAPYRYPHYHTVHDTPDKLRYPQFAQVVAGIVQATRSLAGAASIAGVGADPFPNRTPRRLRRHAAGGTRREGSILARRGMDHVNQHASNHQTSSESHLQGQLAD